MANWRKWLAEKIWPEIHQVNENCYNSGFQSGRDTHPCSKEPMFPQKNATGSRNKKEVVESLKDQVAVWSKGKALKDGEIIRIDGKPVIVTTPKRKYVKKVKNV